MAKDFKTVRELAIKLVKELNLFIEATSDEPKAPEAEPACELVPITLEEVRTVLAELSRDGKTREVKELLKKHGANKLSEVNPDEWETLLEEAAEIRHGS